MKRVLVTGANGQLGSEIVVLSKNHQNYDWVFADRTQITLNNLDLLQFQLRQIQPDIILSCGAYTEVDKAETEKELAFTVNHLAIEIIAKYAAENNVNLIHISTDYVFDGTSSLALNEDSKTNPVNVYGKSKLAGEIACLRENPNSIIIRTSWVYSKFGNNFVKTMKRLMQERDEINVVNDQIGSPTYAADLAIAMIHIIESSKWIPGIYNFSNEGEISWYEFALAIKELGNYKTNVRGISTLEYPTPAKRPKFSLLSKEKIKTIYNLDISNYLESLKKVFTS
ncbi:dTDP-4-dehydrorhamnose reductase [Flavobacterium sp. WLB]|uniref:dTDP-4-dehydrorhamnose reductase n=1 Tax=unclassified Flavobacterium TaxID=196869 RepID=UPI0006AB776C|nr:MULTISPECIES: dTDP-4-dehydrorhamnose reductase [unclassified Flavobacterium]KOP39501.1 dTDP-4-dehydrorhamnose reductase [Flavobacterium sp. VMW]OWU91785.1 dTDP-4-dehydrorhamnose reductase [Flavobacterium sp. NLM]PUU67962.1 dTDP-4-dehydrorhamnose reductase [Flavobacterium sp. WLB]